MELDELKKQRDKANSATKETASKNRLAINDLKTLFEEAKKEKSERDKANSEVAKAKKERQAAEKKALESKAKLDTASAKLKAFSAGENPLKIQSQIEELEWLQQTEDSPVKERALSKKISELRRKMPEAKEFETALKEFKAAREEAKATNSQAKKMREELGIKAGESEKHHQAWLKAMKNADSLEGKIQDGFKELGEKKSKADEIHTQIIGIRNSERQEYQTDHQQERQRQSQQNQKMRQKVSQKAQDILEKFQSGKKISLEEMMVLKEAGVSLTKQST